MPSPIAASGEPTCPQPEELTLDNVLAHALRHLAMLSREDPTIRHLVPGEPPLWEAGRAAAAEATTEVAPQQDSARRAPGRSARGFATP